MVRNALVNSIQCLKFAVNTHDNTARNKMKQLHLLLAFVFGGSMSQLFPGEKFPIKENPNGLNYDMYPGIMDPTEDPENEKLPVTGPLLRRTFTTLSPRHFR